jgi:hypothetical protein
MPAFDIQSYGPAVAAILALDGNGERLMPLAGGQCTSVEARAKIKAASPAALFPEARAPEAALAGLYLYFSCRDEAHEVAQSIDTAEGSYWHAIVHRQEPDAGNSGYWFGRVGAHSIFPELRRRAVEIGIDWGPHWDPLAFIQLCEKVRRKPDPQLEQQALEVQLVEWQLLFNYCARTPKPPR